MLVNNETDVEQMLALVAKLDKAGRDMIEGPITLNEIKTAVDSLTNCTAPVQNFTKKKH